MSAHWEDAPDKASKDAPDEKLMQAVAEGDEQAFNRLLDRHLNAIHRYLMRHLANHADADELSQETFLKLFTQAATFNPKKSRVTTWLHRIAHNLMIDRLRRRPVAEAPLNEPDSVTTGATTPYASEGEGFVSNEALAWLNQALGKLPEQQRWAISLVYLQGFSNREAADIMGLGLRAVESLIARGKLGLGKQSDG